MSINQSPAGVKPVPGARRGRKGDGGGAEPAPGAGRGRKEDGGGGQPVPGAEGGRKCDAGAKDFVLAAVRGSQGDGGGVKTLPGTGSGVKALPDAVGSVKSLPGAGGGVKNDGGRRRPVPVAGRCGQGDGGGVQLVPRGGRGKEGDGGEEPPPPPPPSWCSTPVLQSPPPATATEVGRRNIFKALFLQRKTSSRIPLRRVLPENNGIFLTPKGKPCQEDVGKEMDAAQYACPDAAAIGIREVKPCQADKVTGNLQCGLLNSLFNTANDKDAAQGTSPDSPWRDQIKENKKLDPGCAPAMDSMKILRTAGMRKGWGKEFELRFGNRNATKQISAEAGVIGAKDNMNRENEDLVHLVVSSIHDLLSYNPDTTIAEFDSELEGGELGHLVRIARVLEFTHFVRNYTFSRATLHYICSCYDGASWSQS